MLLTVRKTSYVALAILLSSIVWVSVSTQKAYGIGETLASVSTGASDTYVVPSGVTRVQLIAAGGLGGDGAGTNGGTGGVGGAALARFNVEAGDVIVIHASTNGEDGVDGGDGGTGGRLGGDGGFTEVRAGGGGGASTVTINGVLVVVAAGGGGGGYGFDADGGNGGWADEEIGGTGGSGDDGAVGGGGASSGTGGAGGDGSAVAGNDFDDDPAGAGGEGSDFALEAGGGGGGGYGGGGGGASHADGGGAGGGAGSSYAHESAQNVTLYTNISGDEPGAGNVVLIQNLSPEPEDDGDGADETGLPNDGDANGDGTQDSEQYNVTSFPNTANSSFTSVEVSSGCLTSGATSKETDLGQADGEFEYPAGLADFSVGCLSDGDTITVELYFYGTGKTASEFVARKFTEYNSQYQTLTGASVEDVTIGGESVIKLTYSLVDGGQFDNDQEVNGEIVDPAGIALAPTGTLPATGSREVTAQLWLAVGLLGVGVALARMRRRRLLRNF